LNNADPAIRRHIQECPRCRTAYRTIQVLSSGLKEIAAETPPAGLMDDFIAGIHRKLEAGAKIPVDDLQSPGVSGGSKHFRHIMVAAASILIAIGVGWFMSKQISHVQEPAALADDVEYYLQQFDDAAASNPVAVVKGIEYEWAFYENGNAK